MRYQRSCLDGLLTSNFGAWELDDELDVNGGVESEETDNAEGAVDDVDMAADGGVTVKIKSSVHESDPRRSPVIASGFIVGAAGQEDEMGGLASSKDLNVTGEPGDG